MLHGRDDDLKDLTELLGDEPLIIVRGPWGCGKSELLRAFAHRLYRDDPDLPVYLIDVTGIGSREGLVARVAERMLLASHDEQAVVLALHEQSSPVLLLDECDALDRAAFAWLRSLCDRCPGATVYCVAQRDLGAEALCFDLANLPVEKLSGQEHSPAAQMVLELARTQRRRTRTEELDPTWAENLARTLGGNPRALRFAVGLLSVLTPEALLEELKSSQSALFEGGHADALIERFAKYLWVRLSDESKQLLALIAANSDGVEIGMLPEFYDTVPSAQLTELETLSLVERERGFIRSAPLVDQLIRRVAPEVSKEALSRWSELVCARASGHLPNLENPSIKEGRRWFLDNERMLRIIAAALRQQQRVSDQQADLLIGLALAFRISGRVDPAMIEGAHALTSNPSREALLIFQESRGWLETGSFDKFLALTELAEERLQQAPEGDATHVLSSVALAGRWWRSEGAPPEGGEQYETPEIHRFRGAAAFQRGDFEATEREYREWVVAQGESTAGMQHTLALCCLGFIYAQRGKLELAERTLAQALRIAAALGTPRYEGLATLHLAEVRYRQGEFEAASRLAERALERFASQGLVLLTADARTVCGDFLFVEGKCKEAQDHYAASVRIYELGNRNLRCSRSFLRLAAIAASVGNDSLAEDYRAQAIAEMDLSAHHDATMAEVWTAFIRGDMERLEAEVNDNPEPGETVLFEWLIARDAYRTCIRAASTSVSDGLRLVVSQATAWFDPPHGDRYHFRRDTPMRRMAEALFRARSERPGIPIASDELFAIGWPGQRVVGSSGTNRLWVTLSRLRGLGLGETLQKVPEGYLIDPKVELRFE